MNATQPEETAGPPRINGNRRENVRLNICRMLMAGLVVATLLAACGQRASQTGDEESSSSKLQVLATTSILGDVVGRIGGDAIDLTILLPRGSDPHSFRPSPQDVAVVSEAELVFLSGLGLEPFMDDLIANAAGTAQVVAVSEGIQPLAGGANAPHEHEGEEGEANSSTDPHVWFDPNNVLVWVDNIERALAAADPGHQEAYRANAERYRGELKDLDAWIRTQIDQIPANRRKLVTDHLIFGYFAQRYRFEQVGAIVPGYSSMASPSAQELAALEETINDLGVPAVFVGNTVNPNLAARVAEDTGVKLVFLYTGSLTEPGGEADNYLDFMRFNVDAIVDALK